MSWYVVQLLVKDSRARMQLREVRDVHSYSRAELRLVQVPSHPWIKEHCAAELAELERLKQL